MSSRQSSIASSAACATLLAWAPFVVFLRHHGYGLWQPETLLAFALLALAGLAIGTLMEAAGGLGRVLGIALLVSLLADLQIERVERTGLLLAVFGLCALAGYALRRQLVPIVAVAAAGFCLASLLPGGGGGRAGELRREAGAAPASEAAPILHLILDEATSVDAIPPAFDPGGRVRAKLDDLLAEHDFNHYPRAYSRFVQTRFSLAALFNGGEHRTTTAVGRDFALSANAYFDALAERGYALRVHQTDFLDLCSASSAPRLLCTTHRLETPKAIEDTRIGLATKTGMLFAMLARRSSLVRLLGAEREGVRVASIVSMQTMTALADEAARLEPGRALIAHLMLPHFPYAYDASCELRIDPESWDHARLSARRASRYSAESRKSRYPRYLAQYECTIDRLGRIFGAMRASGIYERSWIVVHGDHGARISTHKPAPATRDQLSWLDYRDSFPTLLAVKAPGGAAHDDERRWAIDEIVPAALGIGERALPAQPAPPRVHLIGAQRTMIGPLPEWVSVP